MEVDSEIRHKPTGKEGTIRDGPWRVGQKQEWKVQFYGEKGIHVCTGDELELTGRTL